MAFYAIKFSTGSTFSTVASTNMSFKKLFLLRNGGRMVKTLMLGFPSFKYDAILPARTTCEICIHRYLPRTSHCFWNYILNHRFSLHPSHPLRGWAAKNLEGCNKKMKPICVSEIRHFPRSSLLLKPFKGPLDFYS